MVLEMFLGAPKIGQRSSSLSRTVQINRNRSRPGADLGAIWLQGRIFLDLAPFVVDFGTLFWLILEECSMNLGINFGRIFNDFSLTYVANVINVASATSVANAANVANIAIVSQVPQMPQKLTWMRFGSEDVFFSIWYCFWLILASFFG